MNKHSFKKEWAYGALFILVALVSGFVTGFWSWSLLLWSLVYILWKWVELVHFYRWYEEGSQADRVPLNHGVWEELSSLVIHTNKSHQKIEKKNHYLLNQFNTMAQAMPYATVMLNKRFEVVWSNQSAHNILNLDYDKDKRNKISNIIRDPNFINLLDNNLIEDEIKIAHPNDAQKRIYIKLVKLSNKRYLLVARDISEQDALRKSRKAFVDNASHELRTPLTVISGYLEMMHNAEDIPETWQQGIRQAQFQSKRMEKIINDMLKLSSMEHEPYLEDTHELIQMPSLLNRLFNDVKNSSKAQNHLFTANIDSSLMLKGNEEEITSIILNLLNNAVIHTKANTKVSLKWFLANDKAHLWVCDNGEGISTQHLPHLSERFYRVDNARDKNTNSTGLGLAIVKQICENHQASLEIESEVGKGTCFKISFPVPK